MNSLTPEEYEAIKAYHKTLKDHIAFLDRWCWIWFGMTIFFMVMWASSTGN